MALAITSTCDTIVGMAMTVKLSPSRKGILVDGEELRGFPYLEEMAESDQLRVAAWARKLAPGSLTAAQRCPHRSTSRPPLKAIRGGSGSRLQSHLAL